TARSTLRPKETILRRTLCRGLRGMRQDLRFAVALRFVAATGGRWRLVLDVAAHQVGPGLPFRDVGAHGLDGGDEWDGKEQPRRAPDALPVEAGEHDRGGVHLHAASHDHRHDVVALDDHPDDVKDEDANRNPSRLTADERVDDLRNAGRDWAEI